MLLAVSVYAIAAIRAKAPKRSANSTSSLFKHGDVWFDCMNLFILRPLPPQKRPVPDSLPDDTFLPRNSFRSEPKTRHSAAGRQSHRSPKEEASHLSPLNFRRTSCPVFPALHSPFGQLDRSLFKSLRRPVLVFLRQHTSALEH